MRYSALPYPMILKPDIVLARHTYVTGRGRLGVRSISSGDSLSGKDSHLTEIDFFLAQVFPSLDASQHPRQDSNAMEMPSVPLENLERSERMRVTSFIISSMLTTLMTLLATLSSIFRSRAALELENLALRHQIGVLRRTAAKRLKLTSADRLLWICLSRLWRGWHSALTIVKPETVIAWHRAGFRLFWTWKVRRGQPGRPIISPEVRALIRKMGRENPSWGAPRIHGELLKLGINVGESSVSKYMVRSRKPPSQTWRTFLQIHAKQLGRGRDISCLMPPAQIRTGAR
jgi:hypothetical protein